MQFEPKELLERLEYDKIIDLVEAECYTPMAAARIRELKPNEDAEWIEMRLKEVYDYKLTLEKNDRFPLEVFSDITPHLPFLKKEGYALQAETFMEVLKILLQMRAIFRYFSGVKKEIYPSLYAHIAPLHLDEDLIAEILKVFTEEGNIRPDASPELQKIRRMMQSKERELDSKFRQLINDYRKQGYLADSPESFRNNRRVLAVPAEHKRKIKGIIHDESDTGRTAFIEPEAVLEINNDIFDLEQDERREIYKILRDLSAVIRPWADQLADYQEVLTKYDVIQSKAKLAVSMRANLPQIEKKPLIALRKAYHPLLYLKNKAQQKRTVPFELRLKDDYRILMLSGPNAGGKSVTMKAVGLLQLMVQSGLLVPVHETSKMGIFKKFFADIGDQQSLEDDLSTYSSRLKNARLFTEKATPETLVLIDEMGSGTDPKPGGAIAEALLRELNNKGVFGVFTTHYGNLKAFAFRNHGILNANMHFDKDTMNPTYELNVGRPGSSYAFEIAQKSGLKKSIIHYARMRTGKGETAVDDLLIELQREKQELEEQLDALNQKQSNVDRLIKTYEGLQNELDVKRKKLKIDEREFKLRQQAEKGRALQVLIKQLKEEKNIEKAQQLVKDLRQEQAEETQKVDEIYEEVVQLEQKKSIDQRPIQEGDHVRMRSGGATGQVEEIKGKNAMVVMGQMRLKVPMKQLVLANAPIVQTANISRTDLEKASSTENKLDIRGMMQDEAMTVVERFLDEALMGNAAQLHILHGKGTGALKKIVRNKIREYGHNISRAYHPAPQEGGDGITIVELA